MCLPRPGLYGRPHRAGRAPYDETGARDIAVAHDAQRAGERPRTGDAFPQQAITHLTAPPDSVARALHSPARTPPTPSAGG
ncbi:hypothetical protein [Streptomyces sp. TRM68367]|uniref:hypothetical protein n=1 Tax=Streptomyces sp. TRM68367 TaxID=2758415 RepID=UPI0019C56572|nr:hypothetical protein [Streptomyces sp. TRM68367]MBC9727128.1 hypothetical protein [Streptomyces sp. TRM68367]